MGIGKRLSAEGPSPSPYLMLSECPGREEAKSGRPFRGKMGDEVTRYLDGVRLPGREEWRLSTWIREWCGEDGEYTKADFDRDEPALRTDIATCCPWLVVPLGRTLTRYFLGDVDMDEVHGIPWRLPTDSSVCGLFDDPASVVVVPIYNPAAGFKSPELSAQVAYDFSQLPAVLLGDLQPRVLYDDPISSPDYHEITTEAELDEVMRHATQIATDTEGYAWEPWSVQLTVRPGESFILRCRDIPAQTNAARSNDVRHSAHRFERCSRYGPLVAKFVSWVNTRGRQYRWTFHNALHDLAVFRALGIDTTELQFDDTMIMAYNLQLEPQGLKPLCARWCGMKMQHYDEVMGNTSLRLAQDWLMMALENEEADYDVRCQAEFTRLTTTPYVDAKGKTHQGRRLKVPPKLPRTDLHKAVERCLRSNRPRGLWDDQVIDRHVDATPKYGAMWHATLNHVDGATAIQYAGRDSDGTCRLAPQLEERVRANALWDTYQADLGTVPLIDRMQHVGIRPDLSHFQRLSGDLEVELVEIRTRLASAFLTHGWAPDVDTAFEFNANSGAQTAELLFTRLGIASLKRTPGGADSTNDKVLEALEKDTSLDRQYRDTISTIREYREVYKLKSTFVDAIPDFVHRWPFDGRVHPTFRITRVVTGRLAASDPNILAMPKHGKFAKRFRAGFVAGDFGEYLCSWDLSQIELRVLAHLSQDPVLLNAFRTGVDLHATLAQRIFGVAPKDQDESKHRLPAKAVNFGIPMGMTNIGLCLELRKNGVDIGEDDAQRWLTDTMSLYKEVPAYQQAKIAQARRFGFVTDIRGRRRYIGGIRSYDRALRSEAERFAFSTPIQAGAQEVMKEAEAYVYKDILLPHWKHGNVVEPLIQIHDDLVLESALLRDGVVKAHPTKPGKKVIEFADTTLHDEMVYAMTQVPAHWLSVPIETEGTAGVNWGSMYALRKAA